MSYGYVPPPPPVGPPQGEWRSEAARRTPAKAIWMAAGAGVGLVVLLIAALMAVVFGAIKSSEPYRHAVEVATHDQRVIGALGAPVKPTLLEGHVNENGSSGKAELTLSVVGSSGRGTVFVTAHRSDDVWSYQNLVLRVEGTSREIDLLKSAAGK